MWFNSNVWGGSACLLPCEMAPSTVPVAYDMGVLELVCRVDNRVPGMGLFA